jgi:dihydroorotate dehydrogenase electron transfer subunit
MFKKVMAVIRENEQIASNIYRMRLFCEGADLDHFVPGQFADLAVPGHGELLLKRPLSICTVDAKAQTVTLVYQIKGKGTKAFSELRAGDGVDAILPIGRGFSLNSGDKTVFLVGGGVGIAPLLSAVQKWRDKTYEAFLGYRGKEYEYCLWDFKESCAKIFVTSDDGTLGDKGFVTQALEKRLNEALPDVILACGPIPMLKALQEVVKKFNVPAQVSMEQRMGCGFGACSTCTCGINSGGGLEYKKVCVEGPVFDLREVVL